MTGRGRKAVSTAAGWATYVVVALMLVQLLAHLSLLTRGTEYLTSILTHDDSYYYLETAFNHSKIGHPSFDGVNETNGVHILWYVLVLALSYILPSKHLLLPAAIGLCSLLCALPHLFFIAIGRLVGSTLLITAMSFIWFGTNIGPNRNINGMENCLHCLVLCWVLYEMVRFFDSIRLKKKSNLVRLTLALVANALCRFDSGILSVSVFVICIIALAISCGDFMRFVRTHGRVAATSTLVAVGGAGLQSLLYLKWGGTAMPVSGMVKMLNLFPSSSQPLDEKGYRIIKLSLIPFTQFAPPHICAILLALVSICVIALAVLTLRRRVNVFHGSLAGAILVLFSGCTTYAVALWLAPTCQINYWYFSAFEVYWVFCLAVTLCIATRYLFRMKPGKLGYVLILSTALLFVSRGIHRYVTVASLKPNPDGLYLIRYQASLWLRDNIPRDYTLGSWNAGQLGFFSEHAVIDLDGLVNDKEYLTEVLTGKRSLSNYLRAKDVRFIVDYCDYTIDGITDGLTIVRSFPVARGGTGDPLRVWDLSSLPENVDIGYYGMNDRKE